MLYEIEAISLLVILTLSLGKGGVSNFLYYKVTFFFFFFKLIDLL